MWGSSSWGPFGISVELAEFGLWSSRESRELLLVHSHSENTQETPRSRLDKTEQAQQDAWPEINRPVPTGFADTREGEVSIAETQSDAQTCPGCAAIPRARAVGQLPRASPQSDFALRSQLSRLDKNLNFQLFFLLSPPRCCCSPFSVLWRENCVSRPQHQVLKKPELILDVVR